MPMHNLVKKYKTMGLVFSVCLVNDLSGKTLTISSTWCTGGADIWVYIGYIMKHEICCITHITIDIMLLYRQGISHAPLRVVCGWAQT